MAGSEGCGAFRNNAGVDEPLQKVVPELGVYPPHRSLESSAGLTAPRIILMLRRTQGVPLRLGAGGLVPGRVLQMQTQRRMREGQP